MLGRQDGETPNKEVMIEGGEQKNGALCLLYKEIKEFEKSNPTYNSQPKSPSHQRLGVTKSSYISLLSQNSTVTLLCQPTQKTLAISCH